MPVCGCRLSRPRSSPTMTTFETITIIITGAGVFGALITLIVLIKQTRAATDTFRLTVRESIHSRTLEIHKIFLEKPDLREYFYDGRACEPGCEEYPQVRQMAELLCDFYDSLLMQH